VFLRNLFVFKFTPICNNSFIIILLSYPPEEAKVATCRKYYKRISKITRPWNNERTCNKIL